MPKVSTRSVRKEQYCPYQLCALSALFCYLDIVMNESVDEKCNSQLRV